MADEDGIFDGFPTAWDYCEDRIAKSLESGRSTNTNYLCIYRAFIRWFDSKWAHYPIVDHDDNENPRPRPYRSTDGLVFITQYNVELYFSTHVVLTAVGSNATNRRKVSALNWYLQHVEDRAVDPPVLIQYTTALNRAIEDSYQNHVSHSNTAFAGTDPHKGLKDLAVLRRGSCRIS
jgi:hypothetical protein